MPEQKIIGKGTWIDKLASELIDREKTLGRNTDILRVESGLRASGIPHIGSLGDAARAYGVKLASENLGYKSELIAYSDDLDGLRKIPEGFPDSLNEHLAKPVSLIPDPFGCHDSYGMHMSSLLIEGLDDVGIKYEFRRAKETYEKGLLQDQIHTILVNSTKIGDKIADLVGQEKYQKYLPYFPVCANCNRLYTAEAYEYVADEKKVKYRCKDSEVGSGIIKGCDHEGEADIRKDLGKLAWKVEFAARWNAFDIRFEAYGKDIMDSVKVNDWVADEILSPVNDPGPAHTAYRSIAAGVIACCSSSVMMSPGSRSPWVRAGSPMRHSSNWLSRASATLPVGVVVSSASITIAAASGGSTPPSPHRSSVTQNGSALNVLTDPNQAPILSRKLHSRFPATPFPASFETHGFPVRGEDRLP